MRPISVTAFCPGHISGYFRRVEGKTKATTGSMGAGIVISEGVTVTVFPSDTLSVRITRKDRDGKEISAESGSPPISFVLNQLGVTAVCHDRMPAAYRGRVRALGGCPSRDADSG